MAGSPDWLACCGSDLAPLLGPVKRVVGRQGSGRGRIQRNISNTKPIQGDCLGSLCLSVRSEPSTTVFGRMHIRRMYLGQYQSESCRFATYGVHYVPSQTLGFIADIAAELKVEPPAELMHIYDTFAVG